MEVLCVTSAWQSVKRRARKMLNFARVPVKQLFVIAASSKCVPRKAQEFTPSCDCAPTSPVASATASADGGATKAADERKRAAPSVICAKLF